MQKLVSLEDIKKGKEKKANDQLGMLLHALVTFTKANGGDKLNAKLNVKLVDGKTEEWQLDVRRLNAPAAAEAPKADA